MTWHTIAGIIRPRMTRGLASRRAPAERRARWARAWMEKFVAGCAALPRWSLSVCVALHASACSGEGSFTLRFGWDGEGPTGPHVVLVSVRRVGAGSESTAASAFHGVWGDGMVGAPLQANDLRYATPYVASVELHPCLAGPCEPEQPQTERTTYSGESDVFELERGLNVSIPAWLTARPASAPPWRGRTSSVLIRQACQGGFWRKCRSSRRTGWSKRRRAHRRRF